MLSTAKRRTGLVETCVFAVSMGILFVKLFTGFVNSLETAVLMSILSSSTVNLQGHAGLELRHLMYYMNILAVSYSFNAENSVLIYTMLISKWNRSEHAYNKLMCYKGPT
jgi:hypothetical protein